ncbi:MAG: SulP family inorganic anion transporter [Verrucomicrobiales bacterium]|nr:SulP family inorganic anion transporter [Verrucomicrobiales bacterium]
MNKTDNSGHDLALAPGWIANLKYDLPASLVVFLVATPLCLGIAMASGAPLFAGLIAGIVGGIVVGAASGSPLGVSGPAAGLAVIVLNAIASLGSYEAFLLSVILAGVFQVVLGFMRAGIIGYYFPSSVIKGMLSGIGLIIILKQIPHAFGYDRDPEGSMQFRQPDQHNTLSELYYMFDAITPGALVVAVVSLAILILWERPFVKRIKALQYVQGPLVAVVAGILLNLAFAKFAPSLAIDSRHLVSIPIIDGASGLSGVLKFPDLGQLGNSAIWTTAFTLAIVASLETLLCVEATDKLDPFKRITPTDRELKAQGLGNILSGLIGGLPITQVIVRSSANIMSGGRTKTSAIVHGVLLLVAVLAIPRLLNLIPLATLAAVLLVVGYKLAKPALFKSMYRLGWFQFIPFIVTVVGILLTDLLVGIALGMGVAIFHLLLVNLRNPYFLVEEQHDEHGDIYVLHLSEDVSFLNRASIMQTLDAIPPHTRVVIDATRSVRIDFDVYEILKEFEKRAELNDITVTMNGVSLAKRNDSVERAKKVFTERRQRLQALKPSRPVA